MKKRYKRYFMIISVLLCIMYTAAIADEHVCVQGFFCGSTENLPFSADLYKQDDRLFIVSSLLPEIAVSVSDGQNRITECISAILSINTEQLEYTIKADERIFSAWIQQLFRETRSGVFTGDVFDRATTVTTSSFLLSDYLRYTEMSLMNFEANGNETEEKRNSYLLSALKGIQYIFRDEKLNIQLQSYDEGSYYTVSVIKQHEVFMTVSVDNTLHDCRHMVVGYRENGRYYFRDVLLSIQTESFAISSGLYCSNCSSYRMLTSDSLLFTERFSVAKDKEGMDVFQYSVETPSMTEPFAVSGSIAGDEIRMKMFLQQTGNDLCSVSVYKDNMKNTVSFSDKKTMYYDRINDREEIHMTFLAGIMQLAADIIPALPLFYQKILMFLISDL